MSHINKSDDFCMWIQVRNIAFYISCSDRNVEVGRIDGSRLVYFDDEASAALNQMKNVVAQIFLVDIARTRNIMRSVETRIWDIIRERIFSFFFFLYKI